MTNSNDDAMHACTVTHAEDSKAEKYEQEKRKQADNWSMKNYCKR